MKTKFWSIVCCAIFLAGAGMAGAQDGGTVSLIAGDVMMTPAAGGAAVDLNRGDRVPVGATVRTGNRSRVVIVMTDNSAIRITENSEVVIAVVNNAGAAGRSDVEVQVNEGGVSALIDRTKNREIDFKIQTPNGVATARGTHYGVVVHDGKTYTKVEHGKVAVSAFKTN